MKKRDREDETAVTVSDFKQHRPVIWRLQQLHVAVRHSNWLLAEQVDMWTHRHSAACGWRWWSTYCFSYLRPLLVYQSINRLVYCQSAWTKFKSRLTKYAVVQLYIIAVCVYWLRLMWQLNLGHQETLMASTAKVMYCVYQIVRLFYCAESSIC